MYRKVYFLFTHVIPILKRTGGNSSRLIMGCFYVWVQPGAHGSFTQTSCCLCLTSCQDGLLLSFKDTILENQPALPDASSLQVHLSWDASQQISGGAKACFPEVQGCIPAIVLAPSSQDPEPSLVHWSQGCPHLHIPEQFSLVCKN